MPQLRPAYIRPCGGYTKIYPNRDVTAQARYERVLEAAEEVFDFSVAARTQKTLAKVLVCPAISLSSVLIAEQPLLLTPA